MELGGQIKKFRNEYELSQEELAERIYVSRQTISNWEKGRSYPNIYNLQLLSSLFNVSLDTLIKEDLEIMKEKIEKNDVRHQNLVPNIFVVLYELCFVTLIPLIKYLELKGIAIWIVQWAVTLFAALNVKKLTKKHDLRNYKEIVAFVYGQEIDEEAQRREEEEAENQKTLFGFISGVVALLVCVVIGIIIN